MAKASELNKFTKEEIIWALGRRFDWLDVRACDDTIKRLILEIEQKRNQERHEKQMQIMSQENQAMNKYFEFCKQMQEKYGNENGFLLGDLSMQELDKLASLKSKWDDLRKQDAKVEAEVQREIKKLLKG